MLSLNQSPFSVPPPQDGYLLYSPNPMQSNGQMGYVRYGYPESFPLNEYEEQSQVYEMPLQLRTCPPNLSPIAASGSSMYSPGAVTNGSIPPASNHYFPDQAGLGLVMSTSAATCPSGHISTLNPVSTGPNCYYVNYAPMPYQHVPMSGLPPATSNYHLSGHLPVGNLNFSPPCLNLSNPHEKLEIPARQWSGELHETPTMPVTEYLCRFELEPEMFRIVVEDLKKLFRSRIVIIDDIPLHNSCTPYLFAYFKTCNWNEFKTKCHFHYLHSSLADFVHPEKKYRLKVVIKPLKLPEGLQFSRHYRSFNRNRENQLYVDGLCRMFNATDLLKIYDDLYKNVTAVRVFSDKNGYPNKSALVLFRNQESYQRALRESPILVRTSNGTTVLRNKLYERLPTKFFSKQFSNKNYNSNANGTSYRTTQRPSRDLNGNLVMNGSQQINHNLKPNWTTQAKRSLVSADHKEKDGVRLIRQDARKNNSARFSQMKRELTVFNKLKYLNYLSD